MGNPFSKFWTDYTSSNIVNERYVSALRSELTQWDFGKYRIEIHGEEISSYYVQLESDYEVLYLGRLSTCISASQLYYHAQQKIKQREEMNI